MRAVILAVALLSLATPVSAQDVCANNAGPFTVSSGSPFTVQWREPVTVATATEAAVPHRVDGRLLRIDTGAWIDVVPVRGPNCPSSSPYAGMATFSYRTTVGVAKGNHTLELRLWNFVLDADLNPTAERQEGFAVSVPFVAVDPIWTGPPIAPSGVIIKR